ncbi:MAG TPA: hypothetical protein DDY24_02770 [Alcaligenaceae bacterium]|nr:hypothetical protein [Alcaligenaceae bacterium]
MKKLLVSAVASLACTAAFAQINSTNAPGQTKPAGQSAKQYAPGQEKSSGQSAKQYAPGSDTKKSAQPTDKGKSGDKKQHKNKN